MAAVVVAFCYFALLLWLEHSHREERRDLYQRFGHSDESERGRVVKKPQKHAVPPYIALAKKWREPRKDVR